VRHQLADRRLARGRAQAAVGLEHLELGELGQDLLDRLVKGDLALLEQLQRRGRRDGLGHRGVAEHRVGVRRAGRALVEDAVAVDDGRHHALVRAVLNGARQQLIDC
jgi:hypothetical protein